MDLYVGQLLAVGLDTSTCVDDGLDTLACVDDGQDTLACVVVELDDDPCMDDVSDVEQQSPHVSHTHAGYSHGILVCTQFS